MTVAKKSSIDKKNKYLKVYFIIASVIVYCVIYSIVSDFCHTTDRFSGKDETYQFMTTMMYGTVLLIIGAGFIIIKNLFAGAAASLIGSFISATLLFCFCDLSRVGSDIFIFCLLIFLFSLTIYLIIKITTNKMASAKNKRETASVTDNTKEEQIKKEDNNDNVDLL